MNPFPSREELEARSCRPEALEENDRNRAAWAEGRKLAVRIPAVFGSPLRPRITLHVARGYDDEWFLTEERVAELSALDPEQHWQDVTAEAARTFQEYFSFSDDEGWLFYLPAFIHHYLADFPTGGYDAVFFACVQKKRSTGLLNPEQLAFLEEFTALCHRWQYT